jgi:hypothetical protein
MDAILRSARVEHGRKWIHALPGPVPELPDDAVVVEASAAYTIAGGRAFRWTERGYEAPRRIHHADGLLTPRSTVKVLYAGYRPVLHPTLDRLRED